MKEQIDVDFLQEKYQLKPERNRAKKKRSWWRGASLVIGILFVCSLFFSYQVSRTQSPNAAGTGLSFLSGLAGLITSNDKDLIGEENDRINFLLLGVGGDGHDGGQLTDTIIFASFKPSTGEIGMMSIPRDLAVNIPGYGYTKINAANVYGGRNGGNGPELTMQVVSDIIDEDIHYYVKIDFNSFEELIDEIGGVDVYVERGFTDSQYPTNDYSYKTIRFTEGWTNMDGEEALEFSRSRYGNNGEGSDFARAARQQKVILAAKDKLLSPQILLNPARLNRMANLFSDNVDTNLSVWEMIRLAGYAPSADTQSINHIVLDSSPGGVLFNSTIGNAFVVKPKVSDWSEIQAIAENIFSAESTDRITSNEQEQETTRELQSVNGVSILVQNGTLTGGLAADAATVLVGSGFTVTDIQNASRQDYERTIIIDNTRETGESRVAALTALEEYFDAQQSLDFEAWVNSVEFIDTPTQELPEIETSADFILILGNNAASILR